MKKIEKLLNAHFLFLPNVSLNIRMVLFKKYVDVQVFVLKYLMNFLIRVK